jgi:purine-nucleoside/S-methyl-5'-thioadenosine phosphorylase / adenosine deaminase
MPRGKMGYNTTVGTTVSYQFIHQRGHRAAELTLPEISGGLMHLFGLRGRRPVGFMAGCFGIPEDRVLSVRQLHGDSIRIVGSSGDKGGIESDRALPEGDRGYDALITDRKGYAITVRTADCLPILMWDEHRRAVAAIHAGWRGSLKAIASKTVMTLGAKFGIHPRDIWVGIGPAIGPCCYEVDGPVLEPLQKEFEYWRQVVREKENGKAMLDLAALNIRQLTASGVALDQIAATGLCTYCHPERFESFRREGRTGGGMINGIMICA